MWALAKASAIVVQIKSEAIMAIAPLPVGRLQVNYNRFFEVITRDKISFIK